MSLLHVIYTGTPRGEAGGQDNLASCLYCHICKVNLSDLPAMQETWAGSLGWEDPLEEGRATHSSILAWRISMDRGAWWATVHSVTRVRHD